MSIERLCGESSAYVRDVTVFSWVSSQRLLTAILGIEYRGARDRDVHQPSTATYSPTFAGNSQALWLASFYDRPAAKWVPDMVH